MKEDDIGIPPDYLTLLENFPSDSKPSNSKSSPSEEESFQP